MDGGAVIAGGGGGNVGATRAVGALGSAGTAMRPGRVVARMPTGGRGAAVTSLGEGAAGATSPGVVGCVVTLGELDGYDAL